jgi:CHAT domain-containing protein/tetratricopeptide (TPR) repeat protein
MIFFRLSGLFALVASVVIASMFALDARAESPTEMAAKISQLEARIAQYEAAPQKGKPDQTAEMAHLLAMAQLASLYVQVDRVPDSWPLSEKMLARFEKLVGPDHPELVAQLEANAASYGLQGRYVEAEKLRRRAIAINEKAFGRDSLNVAISLQGMASLMRQRERYDDALAFATRALNIAERKLPAGDVRRAMFVAQVGEIHMSGRRYDEADPLLKRALAIIEAAPGGDQPVAAMQTIQYLQTIGLSYQGRGRHGEAQGYLDRAIATSTKVFGPDHMITGAMLATLAVQLLDQDQLDAAEGYLKQALVISKKTGKLRGALSDNYLGLGLIEYKRKNWRTAYELLGTSTTIAVNIDQIAMAGGPSVRSNRVTPSAEKYLLHAMAAYRLAEVEPTKAAALRDEAFELAQRAERSAVAGALAQMSARVIAGAGPLAVMIRERQDLAGEWQRLDKEADDALVSAQVTSPSQQGDGPAAALRKRMSGILARLDVIDATLAKEFPDFSKLSDPAPLSISEVQALLQPDDVLIFIAHRLNQSLVWAISPKAVIWHVSAVGEEEVTREIVALRCGLDSAAWQDEGAKICAAATGKVLQAGGELPFDLARAHALYAALFGPVASFTQKAHLVIATSGPLATMPLHALVSEPPDASDVTASRYARAAWWAKRNAISNLPSVGSLKALRTSTKASRASRPFVGIANPLLDGPDASYANLAQLAKANRTCAATKQSANAAAARGLARQRTRAPQLQQGGFAPVNVLRAQIPLPETADEVCAVARDLGGDEGDIWLADRASETAIKELSASGALSKYRVVHFATHGALPGQASATSEAGLILTPPKTGTALDDGYLTASEIAGLKLDADWVILSACNTAGAGKAGAEALSGLARAFFYAQARSLLVSHWEVDSAATVQLITTAGNAIQREPGIGRAQALRRAMASLIDAGDGVRAHPRYWAPFVLVGEGGSGR